MTTDTNVRGFAWKSLWAAFALLFVFSSSAWGQIRQVAPGIRVSSAVNFDVSPPMRSIDPSSLPKMVRDKYEIPNKDLPQRFEGNRSLGRDPALQQQAGQLPGPAALQQDFDGLGNADNESLLGFRIAPPDPNMDVGDEYVVQMINLVWTVYNKDGTMAMDPLPNNAVWDGFGGLCESNNDGDPITMYDQDAERWVTSQFALDGTNSLECVAVSVTNDPTGEWYRYAFPTNGFNDYPKLGVGADAYYYTHNDFGSGGGFAGAVAGAFERDAMINGDSDAQLVLFGPNADQASLLPADMDGTLPAGGSPHPFAELLQDQIRLYEMEVDWSDVGNSTFEEVATLDVDPFSLMCPSAFRQACVPQPNGGSDLATLGDRLMHRLHYRDMGGYDAMVASHTVDATGDDVAGVRWYEFRDDGSGWSVHQQGTYAPDDGLHRWMPSIAMGPNGTIAIGYSASSGSQNPSIRFTARPPGAPLGEMTFEEETIFSSPGVQTETVRWGDYSAMVVDPANGSFWYQNEYATNETGFGKWDTHIGNFAFDPDDETAPDAITDLSASPQANNVDLSWTAPADDAGDPDSGPVVSYDVRYSTSGSIDNETDFENATPVPGAPSPSDPGTTENFTATGLDFSTQYWFAIRAGDDNGNTSLSNSPDATTDEAPVLSFTPEELSATIEPNDSFDQTLTISNDGAAESTLEFSFPAFAAQDLLQQPGIERNDTSRPIADASHEKGSDPHAGIGNPIKLGAGGPDDFGYEWIDSNEPGGPSFNWTDITDVGTELTSITDDFGDNPSVQVDLPFAFEFYGEEKTQARVDNNGFVFFDSPSDNYFTNDPIPTADAPNGVVAAFWDDLDPESGGTVHTYDDTDNNQFIVQFTDVPAFAGDATYTFQIILREDGTMRLQYLDMDESDIESATTGIENADGSDGLQVAFNTAYVEDELAVEIAAVPDFLADVSPASGFVEGGQSQDVTVTFNSDGIEPGTYEDDLTLASNDPNAQSTNIPATLNVNAGPPEIAIDPASLDFGEVLEGDAATQSLTISNEGGGPLEVTSISSDNADFTLSETGPITIPFDGSETIDVTFSPDDVGASSGVITVESDDPDNPEATVDVAGEGVPAPIIAVDPDELMQELIIGESAEQTLTVSNTGGSDLDFNASFNPSNAPDGASIDRSQVAAPSQAGGGGNSSAFGAATTPGQAPSTAFQPEDFVYQLDDGSSENAIGLTDGGDVMWLNAFQVVEGAGAVTEIASTFGFSDGSGVPADHPVTYAVYEDPNDDGDPTDAELLTTVETTVQDPHTDTFVSESIPATSVEGTFFIGVLYQNQSAGIFPAPIDESSGSQSSSWVVGNTSAGNFDIENLGNNDVAPALLDDIGFPGNWLLRADGGATFVALNPASGTVAPGEELDVTVTFDATGLNVGTYGGDITFSSNDPANSPLNVPATLEVTSAPYPFALSPESHELTIDVNEDEDQTEVRQVTIENTTDSEQSFEIETSGGDGSAPVFTNFVTNEAQQKFARMQQMAAQGNYPRGEHKPSAGPAPRDPRPQSGMPLQNMLDPVGVTAYSSSVFGPLSGNFVGFDLGQPGTLNTFGSSPTVFAGDFPQGEDTEFRFIEHNDSETQPFKSVNIETGEVTDVGDISTSNGETLFTELATDPVDGTMYASTASHLYTVDPETGEATEVGAFNVGNELMIAIAVDSDGNMYGHGIVDDALYSINKATGQATEIGSTGFDANFAQGMDYDGDTGTLYMTAYNNATSMGELRTVDTETGMTTVIGVLGGGDELGYAAIPSGGIIFIDNDLLAGTLAPGGSVTIDVTVDATNLNAGTYNADLTVVADVAGNPEDSVPFSLEVIADPMSSVEPGSLDFADTFVNDTTSQQVTLTNTGRDALEVSSFSVPEGFTLDAEAPLTLEPGQATALTVSFTPTAVQDYSGTLSIESNAPNSPSTVELSGTGIEAPVAGWDPTSFEVQAYPGQQYERTLTLSNTGGNPLEFDISEELVDFPVPEPSAIFELTVIDEDFNEGVPAGWDVVDNTGVGLTWQTNEDWGRDNFTGGDGQSMAADSDEFGSSDPYDTELRTPTLEAPSSELTLNFKANYQDISSDDDRFAVGISTDGGSTWSNLLEWDEDHGGFLGTPGEQVSLDLSDYLSAGDEFMVRFRYYTTETEDDFIWDWYAQVDDVVIKQNLEFLTVQPTEGTVGPGESQEITYSLDATGLPAGEYQVNYTYSTNDPVTPTKTIPFTIDVIESVSVTPEPIIGEDGVVHPNEEFKVPIDVQTLDDLGVESYQFTLNFDGDLFEATGVTTEGTLSEGLALATNISDGEVQVSAADNSGNDPILFTIEGGGDLIILNMKAKEALGTSDLVFAEMMFNEGNPPVSKEGASVEIVPMYGDISMNLEVSPFDAAKALQHSVGMIDLSGNEAAFESGDVTANDEVSAFDAAKILQWSSGLIDCFPDVQDCDAEAPAMTSKQRTGNASQNDATVAWGSQSEAPSSAKDANKVTQLPLMLKQSSGAVRSVQVTTSINPSKVSVDDVTAELPDDWQMAYHVADDGTFKVAMAGNTPIEGNQKLATVSLRWQQSDVNVSVAGEASVNEADPMVMTAASVTTIPDQFALNGNYPNPFGRSTQIGLDLPKTAQVHVEVYDMLGRQVMRTPVSTMQAGTGRTVQLNASKLASGMYLYRVIAEMEGETKVDTGRMTLVK